ncbi:MAG: siphovirus ReqiPepy6 Gp37-like family protein, partial [Oscillospiraceae bacterium]|nr:siphovirus ReqiPepy6 Gp37-like family protein [Oscillospiraceae bacterium]
FLLNGSFELLGVIDSFSSLIWKRCYYSSSSCFLVSSPDSYPLLASCKYIHRQDINETMLVESVSFSGSASFGKVIARGSAVKSLLSSRVIDSHINTSGYSEDVILSLVEQFAVNPSVTSRKIPNLSVSQSMHRGLVSSFSICKANLLDTIEEIASASSLSCNIFYSFSDNSLVFSLTNGLDRTAGQSSNSRAIFSDDFENIRTHKITRSISGYKNFAYVSGSDYGCEDIVETVDLSSGGDRYEIWVNAGNLKESGVPFDETAYRAALRQKATEKLSQYPILLTVEADIIENSSLEYRTDFDLGDLCSYCDPISENTFNSRITEITETFKNNSLSVSVTLGPKPLSVTKQIKRSGIYLP